jgi:hypothetical protein
MIRHVFLEDQLCQAGAMPPTLAAEVLICEEGDIAQDATGEVQQQDQPARRKPPARGSMKYWMNSS